MEHGNASWVGASEKSMNGRCRMPKKLFIIEWDDTRYKVDADTLKKALMVYLWPHSFEVEEIAARTEKGKSVRVMPRGIWQWLTQ